MDFAFWLQLHSATLKKNKINNWDCGAKPKLAKFDQSKPFADKLVKLSRKLRDIYIDFDFLLKSHRVTIKKSKSKIEFAEWNLN